MDHAGLSTNSAISPTYSTPITHCGTCKIAFDKPVEIAKELSTHCKQCSIHMLFGYHSECSSKMLINRTVCNNCETTPLDELNKNLFSSLEKKSPEDVKLCIESGADAPVELLREAFETSKKKGDFLKAIEWSTIVNVGIDESIGVKKSAIETLIGIVIEGEEGQKNEARERISELSMSLICFQTKPPFSDRLKNHLEAAAQNNNPEEVREWLYLGFSIPKDIINQGLAVAAGDGSNALLWKEIDKA